jgi:hypothetical protein
MHTGETFPLPWEQILWSSSPALPVSVFESGTQYVFTDCRLVVRRHERTVRELPLDEIDSVSLEQTRWQKLIGTSTVRVFSRRNGGALILDNIRYGPEAALIVQLKTVELAGEESKGFDTTFLQGLTPDLAPVLRPHQGLVLAATAAFALMFVGVGIARHESLPPVVYSAEDAIAPNGQRRPVDEIVAFMERDVMPFAKRALAPIVGGADRVDCHTCHGKDSAARGWKMPGVRALPDPGFRLAGLERAGFWLDAQMRNAVYGYLAEEDKQPIAAYMRRVVMPGMAQVMHRPAYDFARSYGYNRSQAAVGCYHCHLVE